MDHQPPADPERIRDTATYDEPRRLPEGIPFVLVNGELAVDGVTGAGHHLGEELRHEVVGLALADQLRVLGGVGVGCADPEGDGDFLADGVRCALMVGVGVGEGVRRELLAAQLALDPGRGLSG